LRPSRLHSIPSRQAADESGWQLIVESSRAADYFPIMSSTTAEIIQVCEALPADKQSELADFARFLLARQDDEAWESRIAYPKNRPRLDSFLRDSAAEGDEPLDPNRL
jgi:hypothetical protein